MKPFVTFLLSLLLAASVGAVPLMQISTPIGGAGGAVAPSCTVAQLAAYTGPCTVATPPSGSKAVIVTDATGNSCTTGGGTYDIPCVYNEVSSSWIPYWGLSDTYFLKTGGTATGGNFSFAVSPIFVLPSRNSVVTYITGELELDTLITDHQPMWQFYDGTANQTLLSFPTSELPATDGEILKYDAASDKFIFSADNAGATLAQERALWATAMIVDVDPNEAGSTSAGFQEALAKCNSGAGNCVLQLRANTTYALPQSTTWQTCQTSRKCAVIFNGADNVWVRGEGDSSLVTYTATSGFTVENKMFYVDSNSNNIQFSDFKIARHDTCAATCTSYSMGIYVLGPQTNLTVDNMNFEFWQDVNGEAGAPPNSFPLMSIASSDPNTFYYGREPTNMMIRDSRFQVSSGGLHMNHCINCTISGNHFTFGGVPDDATNTTTVRAMTLFGAGYKVTDNVIDMSRDGAANISSNGSACIYLALDQDARTPRSLDINKASVISDNVCKGLRHVYQWGIWLSGYSNAVITSNSILGGVCSNDSTRSCVDWMDCGGPSSNTCDPTNSKGIIFSGSNTVNAENDQGNVIVGNQFSNFKDTGGSCPLYFETLANDPNASSGNLIEANVFDINDPNGDGLCGDSTKFQKNIVMGNLVKGAASDCLIGKNSAGECSLSYSRADTVVTASKLVPWWNSYFPSTAATGQLAFITDDPYLGACNSAGGTPKFRSICVCTNSPTCADTGAGWVSINGETAGVTRTQIDEALLSLETHTTDCTALTCDATSDGEGCFEQDSDRFFLCDGSGTPAWKVIGETQDAGTTSNTFTIDSDSASSEPADGAGLIIRGGTATNSNAMITWDATNNLIKFTAPSNLSPPAGVSFPDGGDGARANTLQDNTTDPNAPPSGFTTLYSKFGSLFSRGHSDSSGGRRLVEVLNKATTPVVIGPSDTNKGTLYSFIVPGGTMGATGTLRFTAYGLYATNNVSSEPAFYVNFGGTEVWQVNTANALQMGTADIPFILSVTVQNSTASAQTIYGSLFLGKDLTGGGGTDYRVTGLGALLPDASGNWSGQFRGVTTTAATASDQTFSFQAKHSVSDASVKITLESATLEVF